MPQIPPLAGKGCDAWDTLLIAKQLAPGLADVKPKKGYKVDKKTALGEDWGTTTLQGKDVPDVRVTLTTVTKAHVQQLYELISVLFPAGEAAPDPFDVSHPALAMLGISQLFFEAVEGPTRVDKDRLQVSFGCFDSRPSKPAAGGSGGSGGAKTTKTPIKSGDAFGKKGSKSPKPGKKTVAVPPIPVPKFF